MQKMQGNCPSRPKGGVCVVCLRLQEGTVAVSGLLLSPNATVTPHLAHTESPLLRLLLVNYLTHPLPLFLVPTKFLFVCGCSTTSLFLCLQHHSLCVNTRNTNNPCNRPFAGNARYRQQRGRLWSKQQQHGQQRPRRQQRRSSWWWWQQGGSAAQGHAAGQQEQGREQPVGKSGKGGRCGDAGRAEQTDSGWWGANGRHACHFRCVCVASSVCRVLCGN